LREGHAVRRHSAFHIRHGLLLWRRAKGAWGCSSASADDAFRGRAALPTLRVRFQFGSQSLAFICNYSRPASALHLFIRRSETPPKSPFQSAIHQATAISPARRKPRSQAIRVVLSVRSIATRRWSWRHQSMLFRLSLPFRRNWHRRVSSLLAHAALLPVRRRVVLPPQSE
jgi:hypothetical protein